jgi:predicted DNA-binding protein (MmcQ/YjbR family)
MAHEIMFDEDDPLLAQVRALALALPDSDEKISHGRPAFFTKKVFAYYGGSVKNPDGWIRHDQCLVFLPDPEDQRALEEDPRSFSPAYLGPYGWMGLDLDETTDWTEIAELLESSFRLTAPKRSIARLDHPQDHATSAPT